MSDELRYAITVGVVAGGVAYARGVAEKRLQGTLPRWAVPIAAACIGVAVAAVLKPAARKLTKGA